MPAKGVGARPRPASGARGRPDKLPAIVLGAARVFADWGLSRTQMHDIAREAGVAPGTLYLSVESKIALFDLAIRYGMGESHAFLADVQRPHAARPEETLDLLRRSWDLERIFPVLHGDLREPLPADRFGEVLAELHDVLAVYRYAIRMVERSVREWAELAYVLYEECREPLMQLLVASLEQHQRSGDVELPGNAAMSARLILEYTSWSAVHRQFDGAGIEFDADGCRATTLKFLARAIGACAQKD